MKLVFYKSSAEKIVLDKISYLSDAFELNGVLRDECNIINPVIEISKAAYSKVWENGYDIDVQSNGVDVVTYNSNRIPVHNYVYIPDFNRYYFVIDIVSVNKNLWKFNLEVDVLMSFKDDILQLTGIVDRSTIATRKDIKDKAAIIPAYYTYSIMGSEVPSPIMTGVNSKYYSVIVSFVASSNSEYEQYGLGNVFDYVYPPDIVARRCCDLQSNLYSTNAKVLFIAREGIDPLVSKLDEFLRTIGISSDNIEAIISIISYPFSMEYSPIFSDPITEGVDNEYLRDTLLPYPYGIGQSKDSFHLGTDDGPIVNAYPISSALNNKVLIGRFDLTKLELDWENTSPYTKYYIYIPYLGYRELTFEKICGKYVEVYFIMNWDDGSANVVVVSTPSLNNVPIKYVVTDNSDKVVTDSGSRVWIYTSDDEHRSELLLLEENVQVGISIPISASNEAENSRKREAYSLQLAATEITSVISLLVGVAAIPVTGGLSAGLAIGGGIAGMVAGGFNYAAQESLLIDKATSMGNLGNVAASCSPNNSHILICKQNISYPADYEKIIGKPDLTTRKLGDISNGYVKYAYIHVNGLKTATSNEIDKIESKLMQGILVN